MINKLNIFKSIKIVAGPAVFECGDGYAVAWATSTKGTGCVLVDGKKYWDSQGGVIKTHDNVHVVKLPKESLKEKTYKVISERVNFKFAYNALKGKIIESKSIEFSGTPSGDEICILSVSDVHDMAEKMYNSVKHINANYDLLLLLGDISSVMVKKKVYISSILNYAGKLTQGKIPVVYTRGNHETRGEFASQMKKYFPTSTGEYYFTFDFGNLSAVVIDSGEDKQDDHVEYSGLVNFSDYREQEYNWLCSLKKDDFKGKYLLALSHTPKLSNHFGKDWTKPLKDIGAQLLIGGHLHVSDFIDGELPIYVECGKRDNTDEFAAALIILKNKTIKMKTVNNKGETILEKEINI